VVEEMGRLLGVIRAALSEDAMLQLNKLGNSTREIYKKQLKNDFNRILDETTNQQMIDTNRRVNKINRMTNGGESLLDIGTGLGFFLDGRN
jgi:hypothetical protein